MRPKSLALLMLALGCGLVASIGITEVLSRRNAVQVSNSGEAVPIFVAVTDIGMGDLVTTHLIKLEQWPKDKIPKGAISRIEDIEGRRCRTRLYAGEPILDSKLLGRGASEQGATALIPKGYRVVPVQVDLVSGGSSLILPGDRVDVMVHLVRNPSRDIQETVTRTILQDIKVFAVNDVVDLEQNKDSSRTITAKTISLLVTPEQAAKLMLATQLGTINLVMRSPEDDQQTVYAQARPNELFAGTEKSDRDKESLTAQYEEELGKKTQGFLEFLNSLNSKAAKADPAPPTESKTSETWTMRVLKPGEVQEVQFEAEHQPAGKPDQLGVWKTTTAAVTGTVAAAGQAVEPVSRSDVATMPEPAQEPVETKRE